MNTLTKTQVLALFLGTASAQFDTHIKVLNGITSADTVPEDQLLMPANSGAACTGNADCINEGEQCAAILTKDGDLAVSYCVNKGFCGWLGKMAGEAFWVSCWADPAQGEILVPPALVDQIPASTYVKEIADLITKVDYEPKLETVENLLISSKFDYQDGWYILADGKWGEVDKEADNRCVYDVQCKTIPDKGEGFVNWLGEEVLGAAGCCATHPDTNNRRCIAKEAHGVALTVGPATFSPSCESLVPANPDEDDEEPENAQDDIAKGALADASEELEKFFQAQMKDAKENAEYDGKSDEDKQKWDEDYAAETDKRDKLWKDLKALVGYEDTDKCNFDCQALFEVELLEWSKQVYEVCKADSKSIACRQAAEIKKDEEEARAAGEKNFYTMTVEERSEFKKGREEKVKSLESTLAAAWLKDNAPKAGEEGSECSSSSVKCSNPDHCCGTGTPKVGAFVNDKLENICAANAGEMIYRNDLGEEYDFECSAKKMVATAAACLAAAYSLM